MVLGERTIITSKIRHAARVETVRPIGADINFHCMFVCLVRVCGFRNSKEFTALRCHEKQMLKLADVIKTALNEVGCEELPSGCDDISVDHSFIENNVNNGSTEQPVSTCTSIVSESSELGTRYRHVESRMGRREARPISEL